MTLLLIRQLRAHDIKYQGSRLISLAYITTVPSVYLPV